MGCQGEPLGIARSRRLAGFCQQVGCQEIAVPRVERFVAYTENLQMHAWHLLEPRVIE